MRLVFKLISSIICVVIFISVSISKTYACDIAVASPEATASGKPLIWKSRDYKANWQQEMTYIEEENAEVGGNVRIIGNMGEDGTSGGVNEAGFAITNTVIYRDSPFRSLLLNGNLQLMSLALNKFTTIQDLDEYLKNWHKDWENNPKVIDGCFVAIDAQGGAVLYELTSGNSTSLHSYYSKLKMNRIDANTGFVTNIDGELIGNNGTVGYITNFNTGEKFQILNSERELITERFSLTSTSSGEQAIVDKKTGKRIDNGENFIGVLNRCNTNYWRSLNDDTPREDRARTLLHFLVKQDNLTYKTLIQEVAKDANVKKYNLEDYDNLTEVNASEPDQRAAFHTISRYCTNLAFVVNGVSPGEDPRLATMWTILGEPSVGVAVPYFAAAQNIPSQAINDSYSDSTNEPEDNSPSCFLNKANVDKELTIYENNKPDTNYLIPPSEMTEIVINSIIPLLDLTQRRECVWSKFEKFLGNWYSGYSDYLFENSDMDRTVNYLGLYLIQEWTLPLEDRIFQESDNFLQELRNEPQRITRENLDKFSKYCAEHVYENYTHNSTQYREWDFEQPWKSSDENSEEEDFWLWSIFK